MAIENMTMSEQALSRFVKEGRGQGEGSTYVPGLTFRELRGVGRMHRFSSTCCGGRLIHLPSDLALATFLEEHWHPDACGFKEYFPHLDVDETVRIAKLIGAKHPVFEDGSPKVLITDLLVCRRVANRYLWSAVHTIGAQHGLRELAPSDRIKEELLKRKGIASRISFSRGMNSYRVRNLWFLFEYGEQIMAHGLDDQDRAAQRMILHRLRERRDIQMVDACRAVARSSSFTCAACVRAAIQLIAAKTIECSLDVPALLAQRARKIR
jgi:hypothetical protein